MVDGVLTRHAFLFSVCELKAAQMKVQVGHSNNQMFQEISIGLQEPRQLDKVRSVKKPVIPRQCPKIYRPIQQVATREYQVSSAFLKPVIIMDATKVS